MGVVSKIKELEKARIAAPARPSGLASPKEAGASSVVAPPSTEAIALAVIEHLARTQRVSTHA